MLSLMAMSMNPNLSKEQFQELAEKQVQAHERHLSAAKDGFDRITEEHGIEAGMEYMRLVMPFLIVW